MVSKIKEKSIANNAITTSKLSTEVAAVTGIKVSSIAYLNDDTAANTIGGDVITVTGAGFTPNTTVYVDRTQAGVVTYVSNTQITFSSPAKTAGSYILYLYNADGGSAAYIPGINYSGVPAWSTASGSIGTTYEFTSFTGNVTTLSASSDSTVYYLLNSGSLPTGASLNANTGVITGNTGVVSSQTTYNFVIEAKDQENQGTLRNFSITINPDVVTWSSPADGTTVTAYEYGSISQALNATSATGRPVAYTANTLPTGVNISGNTITGTPTVVGTNNSLITATSNTTNRSATRNINFQINPDVVTWSSPADGTLYNITVGGSVTQALSASSAAGKSITYSANTLPAGLSISGSNITGTPNTVANTTSLITATSATTNRTATRTLLWYAKSVAGQPTIGTATQTGITTATVSFTAPASNGNSPITSYTAVSSPGGITGTLSQAGSGTITVNGLTGGTPYTFTVYATNAAGNSPSSVASNQITTQNANPPSVEYLVVAGGGGGGSKRGGGGGAGGYRNSTLSVSASTAYNITVGGGGAGSLGNGGGSGITRYKGSSGSDSTFASITSVGGGGAGGGDQTPSTNQTGIPGGSGGGGSSTDGTLGPGGSGTAGQGNKGGDGTTTSQPWGGAGGGGAGGAGGNVASNGNNGATGGSSASSSITGTSTAYAGGGGGGSFQVAYSGGAGGGGGAGQGGGTGNGSPASPANLGSGGGGAGDNQDYTGGSGSSGVVIIAYSNAYAALTSISGGLSYDQPSRSGFRVYRFTGGTGNISW
jgi:hypothetical protein